MVLLLMLEDKDISMGITKTCFVVVGAIEAKDFLMDALRIGVVRLVMKQLLPNCYRAVAPDSSQIARVPSHKHV